MGDAGKLTLEPLLIFLQDDKEDDIGIVYLPDALNTWKLITIPLDDPGSYRILLKATGVKVSIYMDHIHLTPTKCSFEGK